MDERTSLTTPDAPKSKWQRLRQRCANHLTLYNRLLFVTAVWGFLTGVERAIIMPTLWLYLIKYFDSKASSHYYGITSAAFNISILICSPIYGYLAHKGVNTKLLIVLSNHLEVVGNIVYFLASKPWLVTLGRFVAGLGGGSEVPLYANIMRGVRVDQRTRVIVTLLLSRQFGLIVGPACTIFMHPIAFNVGMHHFDVYNLPGVFMAILWVLHTVIVLTVYPSQVPTAADSKKDEEKKEEKGEEKEAEEVKENENEKEKQNVCSKMSRAALISTYLNLPSVGILVTVFATYMNLMALETVLPPVASTYFGWSDLQTSIVYVACGVTVIVVFVITRILSEYIPERQLLLISLIELTIVYAYLTGVTALLSSHRPVLFVTLILIGVFGHVFGLPFAAAFCESLFMKRAPPQDMNRAQGLFRTVFNVAILVGPFFGGSLHSYPWSVFLIMFVGMAAGLIFMAVTYGAFKPQDPQETGT